MRILSAIRPNRKLSLFAVGIIAIVVIVGLIAISFIKPQITTWLKPGEYRTIQFEDANFLQEDYSQVKIAGVSIGVLDWVEPGPNGTVVAHVKVKESSFAKVGSAPSAVLRPNTILGGLHYIDIRPGGDRTGSWDGMIPVSRTRIATELGKIVQAVQPDAIGGLRATIRQFDSTLGSGGSEAIKGLVAGAPETLRPASRVLDALQGSQPKVDLQRLVTNLERTASVLTRKQGELETILTSADETSEVFAQTSEPVATAIERLPGALDNANAGLASLDTTLSKLEQTADPARPAVQELNTFLKQLEPVLEEARPVVADLEVALRDVRPLVEQLVPTSKHTTAVLNDLRGPVLNRVNGPLKDMVLSDYHGTGPYAQTNAEFPFYKGVGYMLSNLAKAGAYVDKNGHAIGFQPGLGAGTVSDVPLPMEQMYRDIFGIGQNEQIGDGGE